MQKTIQKQKHWKRQGPKDKEEHLCCGHKQHNLVRCT